MIDGKILPPRPQILAATTGITYIGPNNLLEKSMPNIFWVRYDWVQRALQWLKANNPIYSDIVILESCLQELLEDAIPIELISTKRYSSNVEMLNAKHNGYVLD
jgi:hypothetical protein